MNNTINYPFQENRKILLVDDDKGIRDAYMTILSEEKDSALISTGKSLFGTPEHLFDKKSSENTDFNNKGEIVHKDKDKITNSYDEHKNINLKPSYDLTLAENGTKAIEKVKAALEEESPFALAFIDMKMPGINGAETSRRIWEIDPDIKIVIVTAYSEYTLEKIIKIIGRDDILFLRKPFFNEEIQQLARTLTHTWNLEQNRRNQKKILEQTVKMQTAELRELNRKFKKRYIEKNAMIHYLCHEINTPLNWIGAVENIDPNNLEIDDKEMLSYISLGGERLSKFMEEMVSYFDLANPEATITKENLSLKHIVDSVLEQKAEDIKLKKLTVNKNVPQQLSIDADAELFSQMLNSLVDNSVKFSREGGTISVEALKNDNMLRIEVANQGSSIKKAKMESIFDPFANLEDTRHNGMGFGLNLPKARIITELHGWNLNVRSEAEDGETCFYVDIPVT
ncbi:putative Histidine kinase [Desulfamplus magnetovallimortis]|uniref:histidine kinase n=1 Tax=Desulfamplus magnetovallimortis TaxID=1246637 RepID=A0A1W1HJ68_9BACT|nr:hybrid sensor histidine kinase/response regulator [Desulfamplus magnetovallimortis]SLM32519.1 putative Histidine kinase [Desulfamplus magnetovallimortis]